PVFLFMFLRPPTSPLFPYTTLFRSLPEGQRGIFLGGGGSVRVSKLIGFSRVTEMMLTGHVVDAREGHAIGLAHYVVPPGEGMRKDRKSTRLNSSHSQISYAVFCLKK